MATPTKKGSENKRAKLRGPVLKPSVAEQAQTIAELRQQVAALSQGQETTAKELQDCRRQLAEALEHQTATSEVLSIISRSPTDVQPVLDAIVESAAHVCGIDDVVLRLHEGDAMIPRAHFGAISIGPVRSIDEPQVRWIREHGTLHIPDIRTQNDFQTMGSGTGARTYLIIPLRLQGELIGSLTTRRTEVHPFTPAQIKLLETFADQAVIAIENARLFTELEARNNELRVALEQQTATSELLKVIGRSTFDLQPVFETLAENAVRLCDAERALIERFDGEVLRLVADHNASPELRAFIDQNPIVPGRQSGAGRAALERRTIHIHDTHADAEYTYTPKEVDPLRTLLAIPMIRADELLGVIVIYRHEVRPFTDGHIALMETFADQAAIAIENARLFKELQERNSELREALEHQTATAEVLGIISRSPTDVQPVLDLSLIHI